MRKRSTIRQAGPVRTAPSGLVANVRSDRGRGVVNNPTPAPYFRRRRSARNVGKPNRSIRPESHLDGIAARSISRLAAAFEKASLMTDPSLTPEKTPDVTETIGFLRRFSDMMATGYNAAY